ncbi:MAG: 4Fe-4S binding protein, partial [Gorillibacterium sp.]|nr:4Fe-4S binding protein [Gorillibacterium sp.]
IDYQYCKGCLKCIEVCPTDALTSLREEAGYADQNRIAQIFK